MLKFPSPCGEWVVFNFREANENFLSSKGFRPLAGNGWCLTKKAQAELAVKKIEFPSPCGEWVVFNSGEQPKETWMWGKHQFPSPCGEWVVFNVNYS
jgi:hypothetical protein